MKYIIWLILSFCTFSFQILAEDAHINGALDSIININVLTDNQLKQHVPDIRLQSTPPDGSTVARIYCDNNNFNGFSLTFVSDQLGRLVFFKNNEYPATKKDGHFIPYSLDLLRGESGSLGIDMPPEIERKGFTLFNPFVVYFNDNVEEATDQAELILKMHTVKKASLFHGTFQDTITVTITDL
jgi:hypothetical protein